MATNQNVRSLEKLVDIITGLEEFKPGQQKLQKSAMVILLTQAQNSVSKVRLAVSDYQDAIDHRAVGFSGLGLLTTRVVSALSACGALPQTVAHARAMKRKLSGYPAIKPAVAAPASAEVTPPPIEGATRRARGQDYRSITDYLDQMIDTLATVPGYQPEETDLQVASLRSKLEELRTLNRVVDRSSEQLRVARSERDALMYNGDNSVYQVGKLAKDYVKSIYGYKGATNVAVRKISFTKKQA